MSIPHPILIAGSGEIAGALAEALAHRGVASRAVDTTVSAVFARALEEQPKLGGLVVIASQPDRAREFLSIDDQHIDAALDNFLDLFECLGLAIPALVDDAPVVYVGNRGHLGAWGGAHECAFAGAVAGLMRSLALEGMSRGVRANVIAADFADDTTRLPPEAVAKQIADLAAFLLSPAAASLNGDLLFANRGASLRFREARPQSRPGSARRERRPSTDVSGGAE